jgi:Flp pilus assembly protein TadG
MDERAFSPRSRTEKPSRSLHLGRLAKSERGTAVVEFALIAPLLFLIVFGIIEFGRILNAYNDLTQLAGQGARAAAVSSNPDGTSVAAASGTVDDADCGGKTYSIQCQLSNFYAKNNSLSSVTVCIPSLPTSIGQPVTVKTTYVFNFTSKLFGFTSLTLTNSQTERSEANPTYSAGSYQYRQGQPPLVSGTCS